jgi:nitroreductase
MTEGAPLEALTLLTTTRSVRRRLDLGRAVDLDTVLECLDVALQAPNGADEQAWRFIVVVDRDRRHQIGDLYRRANEDFAAAVAARAAAGDVASQRKLASSSVFWDHLEEVPVLVVACIETRPGFDPASTYEAASAYGSIFPAVWNFQLACRLRGLGSCLVTAHLRFPDEMAAILELPDNFRQAGMIAVGQLIGDNFAPARRRPRHEVARIDTWSAESEG